MFVSRLWVSVLLTIISGNLNSISGSVDEIEVF